jgi:transposase-like protein
MGKRQERRRFPKEFKLEAVRQSERAGVTAKQVAEELGISDRLLYKWRREFLKDSEPAVSEPPGDRPCIATFQTQQVRNITISDLSPNHQDPIPHSLGSELTFSGF